MKKKYFVSQLSKNILIVGVITNIILYYFLITLNFMCLDILFTTYCYGRTLLDLLLNLVVNKQQRMKKMVFWC